MPTLLNCPGYDPNNLFNAVIDMLGLKNDAALARTLGIAPPTISKIRHGGMAVGPMLLMRLHEVTGWKTRHLRTLMGDSSGQQAMTATDLKKDRIKIEHEQKNRQVRQAPIEVRNKLLTAMQDISRAAGAICLDTEWRGVRHLYRFRCSHGHEWQRRGDTQQNSPRCPTCVRDTAGLAERFQATPGVVCLDTEWKGAKYRYRFRCVRGHEWQRRGDRLQAKPGCMACARFDKDQAVPMPNLLNHPGYGPNNLLDAVMDIFALESDVALAKTLSTTPPAISKIRHGRMAVGPMLLIRLHEVTGWKIRHLRTLMGTAAASKP